MSLHNREIIKLTVLAQDIHCERVENGEFVYTISALIAQFYYF